MLRPTNLLRHSCHRGVWFNTSSQRLDRVLILSGPWQLRRMRKRRCSPPTVVSRQRSCARFRASRYGDTRLRLSSLSLPFVAVVTPTLRILRFSPSSSRGTYAVATAGVPTKMQFEAGAFELDFVATVQAPTTTRERTSKRLQGAEGRRRGGGWGSAGSQKRRKEAPTEIYLNEAGRPKAKGPRAWTLPWGLEALHYPKGYSIAVDPSNCLTAPRRRTARVLP